MVTNIIGIRSTNSGGVKKVHFTLINDNNPCEAKCQCKICANISSCSFQLSANDSTEQSCTHNQSGLCIVEITEVNSGKSDSLLLDLDAIESP